jgi:hypothetical protein
MDDLAIQDMVQLELVAHLLLVVELQFGIEHLRDSHRALDRLGDVVDVLRLDQGLQVVFQDFREIVLQLRSPEVFEDFLPIWRVLEIL